MEGRGWAEGGAVRARPRRRGLSLPGLVLLFLNREKARASKGVRFGNIIPSGRVWNGLSEVGMSLTRPDLHAPTSRHPHRQPLSRNTQFTALSQAACKDTRFTRRNVKTTERSALTQPIPILIDSILQSTTQLFKKTREEKTQKSKNPKREVTRTHRNHGIVQAPLAPRTPRTMQPISSKHAGQKTKKNKIQ